MALTGHCNVYTGVVVLRIVVRPERDLQMAGAKGGYE